MRLQRFEDENKEIEISTDCWRLYTFTWIICNDSLFMVSMNNCSDGYPVAMNTIEGFKDNRVFADWYRGKLFVCEKDGLLTGENLFEIEISH
ncbi:hypothetical protein [Aureibacter tunicatorum]|uniref:Uncharacterized protein n=1 Tax=Aureibacter tunicatorum TaxID=866807 RepID=A0AAE4BSF1_9BACT|nr:hypothetical protein [Aureibacter tunicatorum]MDR6238783.1 hypothetical protein [Aureibacter tunicatorum]